MKCFLPFQQSPGAPSGFKPNTENKGCDTLVNKPRVSKPRRRSSGVLAAISTARALSFRKWRHRNLANLTHRMINDCLSTVSKHNVDNSRQVVFQTNYFFRDNFHIKIPYARRPRKSNTSRRNSQRGTWEGPSSSMQRTASRKGSVKKKVSSQNTNVFAQNVGNMREGVQSSSGLSSHQTDSQKRPFSEDSGTNLAASRSELKRRCTEPISTPSMTSFGIPSSSCISVEDAKAKNLGHKTPRRKRRHVEGVCELKKRYWRMYMQRKKAKELEEQKRLAESENTALPENALLPQTPLEENADIPEIVKTCEDSIVSSEVIGSGHTSCPVKRRRHSEIQLVTSPRTSRSPVNTRSTTRIVGEGIVRYQRRKSGVKQPPRKRRHAFVSKKQSSKKEAQKPMGKHSSAAEISPLSKQPVPGGKSVTVRNKSKNLLHRHRCCSGCSRCCSYPNRRPSPVHGRSRSNSECSETSSLSRSRLSRREAFLLQRKNESTEIADVNKQQLHPGTSQPLVTNVNKHQASPETPQPLIANGNKHKVCSETSLPLVVAPHKKEDNTSLSKQNRVRSAGRSVKLNPRSPVRTRSRSCIFRQELKLTRSACRSVKLNPRSPVRTRSRSCIFRQEKKSTRSACRSVKLNPRSPVRTRRRSLTFRQEETSAESVSPSFNLSHKSLASSSNPQTKSPEIHLPLEKSLSVSLKDFLKHSESQVLPSEIQPSSSGSEKLEVSKGALLSVDESNKHESRPLEEVRTVSPSCSYDTISDGSVYGINFGIMSSDDEVVETLWEVSGSEFEMDIEDLTMKFLRREKKRRAMRVPESSEDRAARLDAEARYAGLPIGEPDELMELEVAGSLDDPNVLYNPAGEEDNYNNDDDDNDDVEEVEEEECSPSSNWEDLSVSKMKAIALTARKFRPPSSVELQQREMLKKLQERGADEETDDSSEEEKKFNC